MSIEDLQTQEADTTQESQTEEWTDDSSEEEVSEARSMGWKPPTEWKGEPPKNGFVKAKEFVERGRTVLPIVQSQLKKTAEENAKLKDELDRVKRETDDTISRLERMSQAALKQQRKQIEAEFETRKEAAVEVGDKAAYREADKAQREALKEFDEAAADRTTDKSGKESKTVKDELPASIREAIEEWVSENASWFKSDPELNAVANAHHERLLKEKPGLSIRENLEEVRTYVAKRYPEKFGKAEDDEGEDGAQRRGSRVEGGSRMAGAGGGKSAWSQIPKDAQAQADRFIKDDGLFLQKGETAEKDLQKARERYAKQYLGEDQ